MRNYLLFFAISILIILSCQNNPSPQQIEKWKSEIMTVEQAFNDMAQEEGLVKAFEFYAASDGVIRRKNKIIKGPNDIAAWYEGDVQPNETLTWKPTFIDVSASGDLAYTYGDFIFTYPDTSGNMKENKGVFHTVWKRQENGDWRYVWD